MGELWIKVIQSILSLVVILELGFFSTKVGPFMANKTLSNWNIFERVENISIHAKVWNGIVEWIILLLGELWEQVLSATGGVADWIRLLVELDKTEFLLEFILRFSKVILRNNDIVGEFWVEIIKSILGLVVILELGLLSSKVQPLVTDESFGDWDVLEGMEDLSVHTEVWDWVVHWSLFSFLQLWEEILETTS